MRRSFSLFVLLALGAFLFSSYFAVEAASEEANLLEQSFVQSIITRHWETWQNHLKLRESTPPESSRRIVGTNSNRIQSLLTDTHCSHDERLQESDIAGHLQDYLNEHRKRDSTKSLEQQKDEARTYVERGGGAGETGPIRIFPDYTYITGDNDQQACFQEGQVVVIGAQNQGPCTDQVTNNCQYTCTANDIETSNLQTMLKELAVPTLVELFGHMLSVQRTQGNLILNRVVWTQFQQQCDVGIPIPESYVTTGIPNADILVYISARPSSPGTVAYAGACNFDWDQSSSSGVFGRPLAARINFVPQFFQEIATSTSITAFEFNGLIKVAIHEMTHALGFSSFFYQSYLDSNTGRPYTDPVVRRDIVSGVTPAGEPFTRNLTSLSTPQVVGASKVYYSCDGLTGVELEDFGGSGTAGSHWEMRQVGNEYMSGFVNPQMPISILTLSLFEDMGWYQVNYDIQEYWGWGKYHGCDWLSTRCEIGWAGRPGYFCEVTNSQGCAPDRKSKAACNVAILADPIPPYYQHFPNPAEGGRIPPADFCPFYLGYAFCDNTAITPNSGIGEVFGNTSFCFEYTTALAADMGCWPVVCDSNGALSVLVRDTAVPCPTGGGQVQSSALPGGVMINCPDPALICTKVVPLPSQ